MKHRAFLNSNRRSAHSKLAKIIHDHSWICGSIVTMSHTCGKKTCKCQKDEKHTSYYLAARIDNKRKMICIPSNWLPSIEKWVQTYQEITRLLGEISKESIDRFLKEKTKKRVKDSSS